MLHDYYCWVFIYAAPRLFGVLLSGIYDTHLPATVLVILYNSRSYFLVWREQPVEREREALYTIKVENIYVKKKSKERNRGTELCREGSLPDSLSMPPSSRDRFKSKA